MTAFMPEEEDDEDDSSSAGDDEPGQSQPISTIGTSGSGGRAVMRFSGPPPKYAEVQDLPMCLQLIGAPKEGGFDQGVVFKYFMSWCIRGSRGFLEIFTAICSILKGVVFKIDLVVLVV